MLQFITDARGVERVVAQAKAVLEGGCKWVQVRMKDASDDEVREAIKEIKPLCDRHEAFLILNDRVELAKELGVSGVHVGQDDMPPAEARRILGAEPVIGVTCNTFEEIQAVAGLDIDYIGVGPYRYTETKKNLRPLIGIEGYRHITEKMKETGIDNIPIVAVGGVRQEDVEPLLKAGVRGVAVSGAIGHAENPTKATEDFISLMHNA